MAPNKLTRWPVAAVSIALGLAHLAAPLAAAQTETVEPTATIEPTVTLEPTATTVPTATPPVLPVLGQAGGLLATMARDGRRIFLGHGPRVVILEAPEGQAAPRLIGQSQPLGGLVVAIALDGGRAYVVTAGLSPETQNALHVLDLADPARPRLMVSIPVAWLTNIEVHGGMAYLTAARSFIVVDMTEPAAPRVYGNAYVLPADSQVVGSLAYVASYDGLHVLSVADPLAPAPVGHLLSAVNFLDVVVEGGLAYVSATEKLVVIDVSDPAAPREVGSLALPPGGQDLDLEAGRAYISFGAEAALRVVDVTDPAAPRLAGELDVPGEAVALRVLDGRVYLGLEEGDLRVVDTRGPGGPAEVGAWPLLPAARRVSLIGRRAVASNFAALRTWDLSRPDAPRPLGRWSADERGAPVITAVDLGPAEAYVLEAEKLSVVDLADLAAPRTHSAWTGIAGARLLRVRAGLAYLAEDERLSILDLGRPDRARALGEVTGDWSARDILLAGSTLYLAGGEAGLLAFDIADPARPSLRQQVAAPGAQALSLDGRRLSAATDRGALHVWELGAAGGPLGTPATLDLGRPAVDLEVAGDLAYLLGPDAVVRVLDLADLAAPRVLGEARLSGSGGVIRVLGGRAYVAAEAGGLYVVEVPSARSALSLPRLAAP